MPYMNSSWYNIQITMNMYSALRPFFFWTNAIKNIMIFRNVRGFPRPHVRFSRYILQVLVHGQCAHNIVRWRIEPWNHAHEQWFIVVLDEIRTTSARRVFGTFFYFFRRRNISYSRNRSPSKTKTEFVSNPNDKVISPMTATVMTLRQTVSRTRRGRLGSVGR